jgi:hypothetical protein
MKRVVTCDFSMCQAAELDRSDVTLWYRVGTVALLAIDYELACDAFLQVMLLSHLVLMKMKPKHSFYHASVVGVTEVAIK